MFINIFEISMCVRGEKGERCGEYNARLSSVSVFGGNARALLGRPQRVNEPPLALLAQND